MSSSSASMNNLSTISVKSFCVFSINTNNQRAAQLVLWIQEASLDCTEEAAYCFLPTNPRMFKCPLEAPSLKLQIAW